MASSQDNTKLAAEFAEGLATARRHVQWGRFRAELANAIEHALTSIALLGFAYLMLCLAAALIGQSRPLGSRSFTVALVLAFAVSAILAVMRARACRPTLNEAAERLDLATSDHNRIAIALSLMEADSASPFAQSAIEDGRTCLHRLSNDRPVVVTPDWRVRRWLVLAGVFVASTALASALGSIPASGNKDIGGFAGPDGAPRSPVPAGREEDHPPTPTPRPKPTEESPVVASESSDSSVTSSVAPVPGRTESMQGQPVTGSAGQARATEQRAQAAATSATASGGAHSSSRPKTGTPRKQNAPRKEPDSPRPIRSKESSAVSGGSAGGGALSPVQHDWAQREQSLHDDRDEEETDAEAEDERESSTQRGGVQPTLKDRQEAPSRELGISGEQGPPGTGRGGPTPPKKSRGVASLVLGVPVPDFVKGRVGPGVTKVTHEKVHPTAGEGAMTVPVPVEQRTVPESVSRQAQWPPEFLRTVRIYMIALHQTEQAGRTSVEEE